MTEDDYMEVTPAQKTALEASDAKYRERRTWYERFESIGAVHNDTTGYWEYNGLNDLTDEDMMHISALGQVSLSDNLQHGICLSKCRTNIPFLIWTLGATIVFSYGSDMEIMCFSEAHPDLKTGMISFGVWGFASMPKLREVKGIIKLQSAGGNFLDSMPELREIRIANLKQSLYLVSSKKISDASLKYMVEHADNTSTITISLHRDRFDTLPQDLIDAATAKQISFACA